MRSSFVNPIEEYHYPYSAYAMGMLTDEELEVEIFKVLAENPSGTQTLISQLPFLVAHYDFPPDRAQQILVTLKKDQKLEPAQNKDHEHVITALLSELDEIKTLTSPTAPPSSDNRAVPPQKTQNNSAKPDAAPLGGPNTTNLSASAHPSLDADTFQAERPTSSADYLKGQIERGQPRLSQPRYSHRAQARQQATRSSSLSARRPILLALLLALLIAFFIETPNGGSLITLLDSFYPSYPPANTSRHLDSNQTGISTQTNVNGAVSTTQEEAAASDMGLTSQQGPLTASESTLGSQLAGFNDNRDFIAVTSIPELYQRGAELAAKFHIGPVEESDRALNILTQIRAIDPFHPLAADLLDDIALACELWGGRLLDENNDIERHRIYMLRAANYRREANKIRQQNPQNL